jgi:hypothetical protein
MSAFGDIGHISFVVHLLRPCSTMCASQQFTQKARSDNCNHQHSHSPTTMLKSTPSFLGLMSIILLSSFSVPVSGQNLSELCLEQSDALLNNTALNDAQPQEQTCKITFPDEKSCSVDYAATSNNYEAQCIAAGGQFHVTDVKNECSIKIQGKTYRGTFTYNNIPGCLGVNCSTVEYDKAVADVSATVFNAKAGYVCAASIPASAGTILRSASPIFVITILGSVVSSLMAVW